MEFKEFCKERSRMCKFNQYCSRCYIGNKKENGTCTDYCVKNPEEAERIVSEWAKEHPIVTNADKFMKVFGIKIDIDGNGDAILDIPLPYTDWEWLMQEYQPPRKENADEKGTINHKMVKL